MKSFTFLLVVLGTCSANVLLDRKPDDDGFTVTPLRKDDGPITIIPKDDVISISDLIQHLDSGRIVGGATESPANSNPWQILVRFGGSLCGGTLISANFVLTAAHCLPDDTTTTSSIVAGASVWCTSTSTGLSLYTEPSQQKRTVKKIHTLTGNMAYGAQGQLFDIALLEMNSPFTLNDKVKPASLPTARTAAGTNLVVSGWGTTSEGGSISCKLRQVTVPSVAKAECNNYYGSIKSSQICAGLKAGGKDSCQGDSGGPLVVKRSNTDATVVGVVSYGQGCAQPNYYGVYTDVYTYVPWIKSVLAGTTWTSCGDSRTEWIGDNYCDNEMNSAACFFDAGDCCNNTFQGWNAYCGSTCTCKM